MEGTVDQKALLYPSKDYLWIHTAWSFINPISKKEIEEVEKMQNVARIIKGMGKSPLERD